MKQLTDRPITGDARIAPETKAVALALLRLDPNKNEATVLSANVDQRTEAAAREDPRDVAAPDRAVSRPPALASTYTPTRRALLRAG